MKTDILICGGGASGLTAAITIKQLRPDLHVCVVEKNPRVGKKILVTGNGRCNLGNTQKSTDAYHGTVVQYLPQVFLNTLGAEDFFAKMGLYCRQEAEGRLYPYSNQASSVLDTLRLTVEQLGIDVRCMCTIKNLTKQKGLFYVNSSDGMMYARAVIVTAGGFAAPKTGSDGSVFSWLLKLGHHCMNFKPALVPLYTNTELVRPLKGVRISALVTAYSENGKKIASEKGEVQFTEHALSGICVMNLSAKCCNTDPAYLSLRLLPEKKPEQILNMLWSMYAIRPGWKLEDFLTGLFPKKVGMQLLQHSGIHLSPHDPVYRLISPELEQLADFCQNWQFPITGRGNWNEAQVTAGGILAEEIDFKLQSKMISGLFFAGEVLDLHGNCGGYNLNWAWRSGQYSAQSAIEFLEQI